MNKVDLLVDKSGSISARIDPCRSITVVPITIYQVERFIWKLAPDWLDYEQIADPSGRITPSLIDSANLPLAFASRLSYKKASAICEQLLGGRLPSEDEWEYASNNILNRKNIFSEVDRFASSLANGEKLDKRMARLYRLLAKDEGLRDVLADFYVLVTEFPASAGWPYGKVFVKYRAGVRYHVTSIESEVPGACFYAVIETDRSRDEKTKRRKAG